METLDTSSLREAIRNFFWLVGGALTLKPAAFQAMENSRQGIWYALTLLILAGASHSLGQAVALFFNRVSRGRFLWALFIGGVEFIGTALVWIMAVWIVPRILDPTPPSFGMAVRVISLSFAPFLLGFLELMPYAGPVVVRLLRVWALLAAIVGIAVVFDIRPLGAALAAAIGYGLHWLLLRLTGGLHSGFDRWFWLVKTGQASMRQPSDILDVLRGGTPSSGGTP